MTPRTHRALLPATALLAALVVGGCQTSSTTETVAVSPTSAKCELTATTPPMMEAGGGSGSVRVTAQPECAWNASSTVNWISNISPVSGQGGGDLAYRVAANDGSAARSGEIVVNDTRVSVSQRAPCRYDVSPSNQSVNAAAGSGSVAVTTSSDCAWTASTDVAWITLSQPLSGSGNATIRFTVAANTGGERTGSVAVGNQRSVITQASASTPPTCTYSIAPTSQNIGAAGGAGSPVAVTTQSTCRWSAASNTSWLTITSGASGTGNGSVGFSAAANTGSARTGTLTIANNALTVSQAAASAPPPPPPPACSYNTPSKVDFGKNGGVKTFNVSTQTGCAWTAVANDSWILVVPTSGTGNATLTVTVPPNPTNSDRTGSITVAGRTVTINEDH